MASGEFPTYDPMPVLEAGATAVKQYGWYYTLEGHHRSAYRTPSGVCYDVRDDTNDQLFKPEFALPTAKQLDAVAATWNLTLRKNGRFFLTTYRYGNDVPCGSDADGWKLYERSMVHCADQGWDLRKIQVRYYQPNIEFVWSGSTPADSGDTVAPTVTTPQMRLRTGTTLGNVITTVTWSASDAGTGVVDYNLQHRAGGGHWHNVILSQPAATSRTLHLRPDRSHQFRVRARDAAGNLSTFVSGPKFYPHVLQTGAATLSGTWKSAPDANASGGETRYATQPGATARLHFQGRAIGIVVQRGPGRGGLPILLDGKKVATIDLQAASTPRAPRGVLRPLEHPRGAHDLGGRGRHGGTSAGRPGRLRHPSLSRSTRAGVASPEHPLHRRAALDDTSIHERINALAREEEQLYLLAGREGGLSQDERLRLKAIQVQLDQSYDLLHQRDARRAAGLDPSEASVRPADTVEHYEQ